MPKIELGAKRSASSLREFAYYDMSGGLNIKAAPQEVADNELTSAINVYLRTDGGVEMRKGIENRGAQLSASAGQGLYRFYQQVVSGSPVGSPTAVLLAQISGGTLWNADANTQIGATGALGANAQPWSVAKVFDPAHSGGTDCLVICTGSGGPYLFDGTAISTPAGWASVAGARWCQLVNNVLWFGGIPSQPNLVYGTLIGTPETLYAANALSMSQPVAGLGTLGAGANSALVVGMERGLVVITGSGYNLIEQEVPSNDGVAAGRTMITVDGILYFLGSDDIYAFDGLEIRPVSYKVEPWIQDDPLQPDFPMNGNRAVSWAFAYRRRIYFFYDSGNTGFPNTALVYHLDVNGGWTVISGPKLNACIPLDAPDPIDPDPHAFVAIDATKGQVYNFDVYNSTTAHTVDDAGTAISAIAVSKYFKLGLPGTPKVLLRAYIEAFLETFGGTFFVSTDYGSSSTSTLVTGAASAAATWDVSNWDQSTWGGGSRLFVQQRSDFNLQGEAFAFGVQTSDANPPWLWVGVTGIYSLHPKV